MELTTQTTGINKQLFGDDFIWGVATAALQIEGAHDADNKGQNMAHLAAVEAYPRIAYRSRVVFSERSRPLIFCWVFDGRRCGMPALALSRVGARVVESEF